MNNTPFLPIRGLDANIKQQTPINGAVYFATDTRKIYYSDGSSFISMGGNSGIYYGRMEHYETPDEGQKEFDFSPEQIEGNEDIDNYIIPNENDLIFNIPDNSFYRVMSIEEDVEGALVIHTTLLTIAGGGSGGGSGDSTVGRMSFERIGRADITVLSGAKCILGFNFTAIDAAGEPTGGGTMSVYVSGSPVLTKQAISQGENYVDVGPYLNSDNQEVKIFVEANIGGVSNITQSKRWTVRRVSLNVTWNYDDATLQSEDNILLIYAVSTSIRHQIHILVDNLYEVLPEEGNSPATQTFLLSKAYGFTHGAHQVAMWAEADVEGTTIVSNKIIHTIMYVEEGNNSPIIGFLNYENTVTQYDTLIIPIFIYDPTSLDDKAHAILREDSEDKDIWNVQNGTINRWSYTPSVSGKHRLLISCNNTEVYQDIDVSPLIINNEEVAGYEFKFKASDFISNNNVQSWNSNGVTATFSDNFDWHNGGLQIEKTDNGSRNYVCVKAGTTMTINFKPFENINTALGKTIKIIYKATNCRQYDAQVLECIQRYTDINDRGILINAQNALLSCSSTLLDVPTCEDSYIELELDIWNGATTLSGIKQNYLMVWIDGVPAGCKVYTNGTNFSNDKEIVIGSKDCDVNIYLIKSYNRHLTEDQHLANFIADAYNSNEMIARYRRNDILGDNGDIDYKKLALANPKVKVHAYDIPRMTAYKKDEVKGCTYEQYYGNDTVEVSATNVSIQGQGTSSSRYGISAFNLDTKFYDGFEYPNNTHSDKYSMTNTSIPVNYFNTKVNVASCEGANNALNQEWYNKWQPFVCEYKAKNKTREDGKQARDTMEFPYPGVIFVKDNNKIVDNETIEGGSAVNNNCFKEVQGYVQNPYYKMYAICNMGNSKKNTNVFHDPDNPYECCVEVLDNQRPEQWMTDIHLVNPDDIEASVETLVIDGKEQKQTVYEFRYIPDKTRKQEFSNAWYRLINWMASNNPEAATNEDLPQPETYDAYTFKGYTSDKTGYEPEYQILKGKTINTYAGTYTQDTKERRIAKMLNECEDYLIMDAMVYHYLMIERHTMIDNVAKNTFWSTEDMVHWQMIKDYDNDTSDGNDNQGALTLTYGYEVFDKVKGKDIMVFNATPSVWLHFINSLYQARKEVYLALDSINENGESAWDANSYLKMFQEYQDAIPERCWIYDYHKKYLRPYEVYGEPGYIFMLEGGKKTYQRKQYEIYQQTYMSSEYQGRNCKGSAIEFRGNNPPEGQTLPDKQITITMYSDCYVNASIGSGDNPNVIQRVKRNEPFTIDLPVFDLKNATIYFYSAGNIIGLTDIYKMFSEVAKIGAATRLSEFAFGSENANYVNTNISSISFEANKMLEKLQLQNCPNLNSGLDLSQLISLKSLDTRGSNFTDIIIGDNSPIEELQLNAISSIQLSNLYNLKTFTLEDYSRLNALYIDNIDNSEVNSKNILINALTAENSQGENIFESYMLNNVNWEIDDGNELINDNTRADIIIMLNALLTNGRKPYKKVNNDIIQGSRREAVTGILNITENAYNGNNSVDIYNYYAFGETDGELNFPSLDINFNGAATLRTVTIKDGQGRILWEKKLASNTNIDNEFLSSGPDGDFTSIIISDYDDTAHHYSYLHSWTVDLGNGNIQIIDNELPIYELGTGELFNNDIIITPNYEVETRKYNVEFWSDNNSLIKTQEADYGTSISNIIKSAFPNGYVKSDTDLPLVLTYRLKGWSRMFDNEVLIAEESLLTGNLILYAVFEMINVHNNADVKLYNYQMEGSQVILSPKNPLALQGKVTIPTAIDGNIITNLNSFKNCLNLTHIFFEENSQLKKINDECFKDLNNLIYLEPNNSVEEIGNGAFYNCNLRVDLQDEDYVIGGNNLRIIGVEAFRSCFFSQTVGRTIVIPSSVTDIYSYALAFWRDSQMSNGIIQVGYSVNNPSQWDYSHIGGSTYTTRFGQNNFRNSFIWYSNKFNDLTDFYDEPNLLLAIADAPQNFNSIRLVKCYGEGIEPSYLDFVQRGA